MLWWRFAKLTFIARIGRPFWLDLPDVVIRTCFCNFAATAVLVQPALPFCNGVDRSVAGIDAERAHRAVSGID